MGTRTYNRDLYFEEWRIRICQPNEAHKCQAHSEWKPERCKLKGKYYVKHHSGLTVGVCGNHRRALVARGWKWLAPEMI